MIQSHKMTVTVAPEDTDAAGKLKLSALLRYSQDAAGEHCDDLGVNQSFLDEKGLFWAIIRNRLEVEALPVAGQTITVETWPMPTSRIAYPRATEVFDAQGNRLCSIHSLWILMDMQTRAMVLPGKSGVEVLGLSRQTIPAPKSLSPITPTQILLRRVSREDLDRNDHMNNARYLDWVSQFLPNEFGSLKTANLCYLSEARLGQELAVCWTLEGENKLCVEIRRPLEDGGHDRIFSAQLEYDLVVL